MTIALSEALLPREDTADAGSRALAASAHQQRSSEIPAVRNERGSVPEGRFCEAYAGEGMSPRPHLVYYNQRTLETEFRR